MDIQKKLAEYVYKFNGSDEECYKNDIDNEHAYEWMAENIPLIECPDKTLEMIYYFRWWTFRKHIKNTCDGYVITEFLPEVPWSGRHNAIAAPVGHHIAEAKWLKCRKKLIEEYAMFWLDGNEDIYSYSNWLIYALYEYSEFSNNYSFGIDNLDKLIYMYGRWEKKHKTDTGLFWSIDAKDAMEFSISGVNSELRGERGIRPTLNSYMAANAKAISAFAKKSGNKVIELLYEKKAEEIASKMTQLLWDGDFFKAVHSKNPDKFPAVNELAADRNVMELLGYIPWEFNLVPAGYEEAFKYLKDEQCFNAPKGLTTADMRHKRFMYKAEHECLWNGYVWPFATSQTLNAAINLLNNYKQEIISKKDFYNMLKKYAECHFRAREDGKTVCWIDEVLDPFTGEWTAREILKSKKWDKNTGGYERGKDYNHSAFCDITLRGLLGINFVNSEIVLKPLIPDEWEYFMVDNLYMGNRRISIYYAPSQQKWTQKSFKKRNESQYFVNLLKPTAFIPRFA